jgi:hypothetical protein
VDVVTSAVVGSNADLLAEVAKLWINPADELIDVTAGNGSFWARTGLEPVTSDVVSRWGLDVVADCRALPYRDGSIDVAAFDPPYQPLHGTAHEWGVGASYRIQAAQLHTINDVLELYRAGIAECARVLVPGTGRLLVKCQDFTYNHRLHLVHLDVVRMMAAAGVDLADLFVLVNTSRMPQRTERQQRAHRAHSYLLVGVKARARQAEP